MLDCNGWLLVSSTGAILVLALYGLTAAAHFPAERRALQFRTGVDALVLWATLLLAGLTVVMTLLAMRALPWPVAILAAGGALLVAPLLLQPLPDSFVNGRRGLLVFAGLAVALACGAFRLAV